MTSDSETSGFDSRHVVVTPSNTNHRLTVHGPTIKLQKRRRTAGSCREAVLAALRSEGVESAHTVADIHAMLVGRGATWPRQTVAKAVFRMVKDGTLTRENGRLVVVGQGAG